MLWYDIIGIIGSVLLSIQNFPQIYLIYQKKNMDEISSLFLFIGVIASTLLLFTAIKYGIMPFIVANIVCLVTIIILSCQKVYYTVKNIEKIVESKIIEGNEVNV